MPQENGYHSARQSSRASPLRDNNNSNDNGTDKNRPNRDVKERGYYSELATVNPESNFEVKLIHFSLSKKIKIVKFQIVKQAPIVHDDVLRETFRMSNTARGISIRIRIEMIKKNKLFSFSKYFRYPRN